MYIHSKKHVGLLKFGDQSKSLELYTLYSYSMIWAKPNGDLHFVCLSDGMDKTFSYKNRMHGTYYIIGN